MKILFVCTGNICRSPCAEAILRKMRENKSPAWEIDSAGTGSWHQGEAPDPRAQKAAQARGYDMSDIVARPLRSSDYDAFDRIYAMANEHLQFLREHAPEDSRAELLLFLDACHKGGDVPDPYYGGAEGFTHMMDLLEEGCRAIAGQ